MRKPFGLGLILLALPGCPTLHNPKAVLRYESFGENSKDAEIFEMARSGKSPEDNPTHLALLKELAWRLKENVPANREYQDRMLAAGQAAECLREYRERALVDPSAANLYFLARVVNSPEESESLLRRAISKDTSLYWAHYALGLVLQDHGEPDKRETAKKHLERATQIHPGFAEGWVGLSEFLESSDLDEAKDALKKFVELRPEDLRGRMNLGLLYLRLDQPKDARVQFDELLRRYPKNKDALFALAGAEVGLNNPTAALAHYRRILEIDPQECLAHYNLGILYEQHLEDPQEALAQYQAFQDASASREGEFLLRRLQVEKWIDDLRKTLGLPPVTKNP